MTDGQKEQIKLRANALDRTSTACIAVVLLAPLTNLIYATNVSSNGWAIFWSTVAYLSTALVLHHAALWTLKGLDR